MDTLDSMRVFARVAELGSFAAAARALDLSAAVVTRHVAHLEARLGSRLLHRNTRRVGLTEAGRSYLPRCQALLQDLAEAEALAAGSSARPQGVLRLTAPVEFGTLHLAPLLPRYLQRHPQASVSLDLSNRVVDLIEEEMDLALRIAQTLDSRLVARRLASSALRAVAAPAYLQQAGRPATPAELAQHATLAFAHPQPWERWPFRCGQQHFQVSVRPRLLSTSSDTLRQAALAGSGVALLPTFLVGRDLADGGLTDLFPEWEIGSLGINVVYPSRRHLAAKVQAMVELLFETFGQHPRQDPWWPAGPPSARHTARA